MNPGSLPEFKSLYLEYNTWELSDKMLLAYLSVKKNPKKQSTTPVTTWNTFLHISVSIY